jgi:hypothetical protein
MIMLKKYLLLLLVAVGFLNACKKDLNFDKFNDLTLSPEFGIPLALIEMKMSNILKEDSNIVYDPDGFIRFIIREDSIASFPVDSFVNIPALDPVNVSNKLGLIGITDIAASQTQSLNQMSNNFTLATRTALQAANGTTSIFPAINDQNANLTSFGLDTTQFSSVSISSGFLVLEFKNQLKVTVDQISVNIFNTSPPFQSLIGQLIYTNVAAGSSKKDSINLAGSTLSSKLAFSLPILKTFASSSPVLIDLNDGLTFDVKVKNLKASGGVVVIPSKTIESQNLEIDLKADDPTVRIRDISFESGLINYSISSNIDELLDIKIKIVGAKQNGSPMAPINISIKNTTKTGQIDLSNVLLDLTLDANQPYNKMQISVEPSIISSNTLKSFDSSNYVNANFTFGTLKLKDLNGYLGSREIVIEPSEQTFDFLDQFNNGFPLDDPKFKIFTSNSIGVPVTVLLDAKGTSAKGASQNLNAPPILIGYPTLAQKGQVINDTKIIDKNNSDLVKMLNLPPSKILFGGKASLNAAGFTGYNDFIAKGSGFAVGYEIEMPLSLKTNNLVIEQTSENPLFEIKDGVIVKSKLGLDSIEYIDLILKLENAIPLDVELDMFFADKDTVIMDTIAVGSFMLSAIPDANGRTIKNTSSVTNVRLFREKLDAIRQKNLVNMVVRMKIKTYNNGSQPVKIYSDYVSKIGISAKVKLKYKLGKGK